MTAKLHRYAVLVPVVLAPLLSSCSALGEQVGSTSSVVRTSILPTSVPYYLDLCGQDPSVQRYRLYSPSSLGRWAAGLAESGAGDHQEARESAAVREQCIADRKINNGDPITVRLHRVGIGGLARFSALGKCQSGCKRDIAIVLDFNGSQALQKPIVAFYQRDVSPDGNLQFVNQTIFAQNEWFYRYPPSVRVRLYDVRDDKDRELKANLETVAEGTSALRSYIAGAAVAGLVVDKAIRAAEKLITGPRNRPILDMSFQLFPQQQTGTAQPAADAPPKDGTQEATKEEAAPAALAKPIATKTLTPEEVEALQKALSVDTSHGGVGNLGPKTRAAIEKRSPDTSDHPVGSPEYNQLARIILVGKETERQTTKPKVPDPTFGSPIYASQFIVFNETAPGMTGCDAQSESKRNSSRAHLGTALPRYYFVPDGARAGGGRVYADLKGPGASAEAMCLLETPFVIFSITRENVAVAADVAKRISDLQTKFAADSTVSEESIASLGSAYVDAELALSIDRVENTWRADQLAALLKRLDKQQREHKKLGEDDTSSKPLASAPYRYRAYRLIEDYMGCSISEPVEDGYFAHLAQLLTALGREPRQEGQMPPYLKTKQGEKFKCEVDAAPEEEAAPAEEGGGAAGADPGADSEE